MHVCHKLIAAILMALAPACARALPQRIVSTNLCTDEYLFRLVPATRIAALSELAGALHPEVSNIAHRVGSIPRIRPSAEEVLNLRPDLVLLYQGVNPRLAAQLKAAGVRVFVVPWAHNLAEVRKVTRLLGRVLGVPARARALLAVMAHNLAAAKALAPRPPVSALIYEPNAYAPSGAIVGALMQVAGLANAAPGLAHSRQGTIPLEVVMAARPSVLILNQAGAGTPSLADAALEDPALAALKGHTRIVRFNLRGLMCAGPWLGRTALRLARLAHATHPR